MLQGTKCTNKLNYPVQKEKNTSENKIKYRVQKSDNNDERILKDKSLRGIKEE